MDLEYLNTDGTLIKWFNNLTPSPSGDNEFRFELFSNDPLDITHSRQLYILELTATISTTDMNPAFSWTKVIDVEIDNGCLADQMTNTGDWVDGSAGVSDGVTSGTAGTQIMGFSADTRDSNVWVYYINE